MKWLIEAANNKEPVIPFYQKLADELMDAYQNTVSGCMWLCFIGTFIAG